MDSCPDGAGVAFPTDRRVPGVVFGFFAQRTASRWDFLKRSQRTAMGEIGDYKNARAWLSRIEASRKCRVMGSRLWVFHHEDGCAASSITL
jgi:hypothetical protein